MYCRLKKHFSYKAVKHLILRVAVDIFIVEKINVDQVVVYIM